jgi:hypothetical protein
MHIMESLRTTGAFVSIGPAKVRKLRDLAGDGCFQRVATQKLKAWPLAQRLAFACKNELTG